MNGPAPAEMATKDWQCPLPPRREGKNHCIGAVCAVWRWFDAEITIVRVNEKPADDGRGEWKRSHDRWEREIPTQNRRGFCGMGGAPSKNDLPNSKE